MEKRTVDGRKHVNAAALLLGAAAAPAGLFFGWVLQHL